MNTSIPLDHDFAILRNPPKDHRHFWLLDCQLIHREEPCRLVLPKAGSYKRALSLLNETQTIGSYCVELWYKSHVDNENDPINEYEGVIFRLVTPNGHIVLFESSGQDFAGRHYTTSTHITPLPVDL